jgi:hypothetical protein
VPLTVTADPSSATYQPPRLTLAPDFQPRFSDRMNLLGKFDRMRRGLDASGQMEAMDQFQLEAVRVLTSATLQKAFDIQREDPRLRERIRNVTEHDRR